MAALVTDLDFARAMTALGPFESTPIVAVAVSGGADSMALLRLTDVWARGLGGRAVALSVDHGLRAGSGAEAVQVREWAGALGVEHHILTWTGPKPSADLQAEARRARYRLMEAWCADHDILHLLLAHHRDDQAETFVLRLARGSGVDGLAAMRPVQFRPGLRLLRPLLDVTHRDLTALLGALGQAWIEDPSNQADRFARVRVRKAADTLARIGLTNDRLAETARAMARAKDALEAEVAQAVLALVRFHPVGFCTLERSGLAGLAPEIALRLLRRVLMTVGGGVHPPRLDRLERLYCSLLAGRASATLAGCRLHADGIICRETRGIEGPKPLAPGQTLVWDGRFRVRVAVDAPLGLEIAALGARGWALMADVCDIAPNVPPAVRPTLPAIWCDGTLCAVPQLGYKTDRDRNSAVTLSPWTAQSVISVRTHLA